MAHHGPLLYISLLTHRRDVLAHDGAEEVWPLGEQRVDAPVVGEEARHVHRDGRRRQEGREHRPHRPRGQRLGRADRLAGAPIGLS